MADPLPWRPSPFLAASAGLHAVALAGLCVSPRSWGFVLTVLVANHLVIGAVGLFPRCAWLGPNITRLPSGAGAGLVALTFDDGPDPEVTPAVLGLLEQAGARATFFCVGQRAEAHPQVMAAIRARGHGVGNHSYSHPNSFALRGPRGLSREILRAQEAIERVGGGRPRLFRAPAGIQNPWLAPALASAGLSLGLQAGDILLLHDGSSARDTSGRPVVLEALPRVLEEMGRRGLRSEALHAVLERPSAGP